MRRLAMLVAMIGLVACGSATEPTPLPVTVRASDLRLRTSVTAPVIANLRNDGAAGQYRARLYAASATAPGYVRVCDAVTLEGGLESAQTGVVEMRGCASVVDWFVVESSPNGTGWVRTGCAGANGGCLAALKPER
jgi:hypothetical protein